MKTLRISDLGTAIRIRAMELGVAVDISSATALTIYLKQPDDTVLEKTGVLVNDGVDGLFEYVLVSGEPRLGDWSFQGRTTFSPTNDWRTEIGQFRMVADL